MKERNYYIGQFHEVEQLTKGMTMDQVRDYFAGAISNDLRDEGLIDANYKEILVTFAEEDGQARLRPYIEAYSEDGAFLDVIDADHEYYFLVSWHNTKSSNRAYHRQFSTEAEAVKKARQVSKNPYADSIRVAEMEHWETPEPAPNGTSHGVFLGFIPWWMEN